MTFKFERKGSCLICGNCCKVLKIKIKYRVTGDVVKYLETRGVRVKRGGKYTILTIDYPCPYLLPTGKCKLKGMEDRPLICDESPVRKWQLVDGCGYRFEEVKY